MAKVTSKLQFTIPKAVAEAHRIEPGTELQVESADGVIRLRVARADAGDGTDAREVAVEAFDAATERQMRREAESGFTRDEAETARGWRREDLYDRGPDRS